MKSLDYKVEEALSIIDSKATPEELNEFMSDTEARPEVLEPAVAKMAQLENLKESEAATSESEAEAENSGKSEEVDQQPLEAQGDAGEEAIETQADNTPLPNVPESGPGAEHSYSPEDIGDIEEIFTEEVPDQAPSGNPLIVEDDERPEVTATPEPEKATPLPKESEPGQSLGRVHDRENYLASQKTSDEEE